MAAGSAIFPAFIRAEYDQSSGGFPAFEREAMNSAARVKRSFETSFDEIKQVVSSALTMPRNAGGSLDLNVKGLKEAAADAQAVALAYREVATAAERKARAEGDTTQATRLYVQAARAAATEAETQSAKINAQALTYERLQTELNQTASATQRVVEAQRRGTTANSMMANSMGSQRLAMVQTVQQLNDMVVGYSSGQRAAVIFAQQFPQLTFAMSGFEGSSNKTLNTLGKFGAFMSGTLGFIVTAAATGLGFLAARMTESEEATKKKLKAVDELKEAMDRLNGASALVNRETEQGIINDIRATESLRAREIQTRQLLITKLELAKADREAALAADRAPDGSGSRITGIESSFAQGEIDRLTQLIAEQQGKIDKASAGIASGTAKLVMRDVASATDAATAATNSYIDAIDRLQRKFERGGFGNPASNAAKAEFKRQAVALTNARDAALAAAREANSARGAGSDVPTVAQLSKILREEFPGTRITDGLRSRNAKYGATNSYHKIGQAVDFVPAGGMGSITKDQIRQALESRGVTIAELLGPGDKGHSDHFHVAVTKGKVALQGFIDAERDAAKAAAELDRSLDQLIARFDPLRKAANDYRDAIAEISTLQGAGKISPEDAQAYARQAALKRLDAENAAERQRLLETEGGQIIENYADASRVMMDGMIDAGRAGAQAFRDEGLEAAQAIAQIIGGKAGKTAGSLLGLLQGAKTGNFNSVGGKLGGALTLLSGGSKRQNLLTLPDGSTMPMAKINSTFGDGFRSGIEGFSSDLSKQFKKVFGDSPLSSQLGSTLGSAFAGAQFGGGIGNALTDVLGVKGSKLGGQIGGAIGSMIGGPLGSIIGGTLGSLVGGAFKKTPTGSATIGVGANGELLVTGVSGSSKKLRDAANDNAGGALTSIERIAEALGATINASAGSVSIGFRKNNARVDTSGSGITKTSKGAIDFGEDVEAAVKFATLDLIKDGVLEGLRAGTQRLLQNAKDLEQGLDRALKFENVFRDLKRYKDPIGAALDDLDKEFKSLIKVFADAGASTAEYADLEELYGIRRKEAIEQAGQSTIQSLKDLLRDLTTGDNGLSLRDRSAAAYAEFNPLLARVQAGDSTAFDAFTTASQTVLDIVRQIEGSGEAYFSLLDLITSTTRTAITNTEAGYSDTSNRPGLFDATRAQTDAIQANANAITNSIDNLGQYLGGILTSYLGAANDNLGTLIQNGGGGGGGLGEIHAILARQNF